MTDEQKDLHDRAFHAVATLAIVKSWCNVKKNPNPKLACECEAARVALIDLLEDWHAHLGEPLDIKPAVKARWLRELANQIEEGDNDEE